MNRHSSRKLLELRLSADPWTYYSDTHLAGEQACCISHSKAAHRMGKEQ
jgi:hypothetical protein